MDKECIKADISFGKCRAPIFFPYRELWRYGTHALYFKDGQIKVKRAADSLKDRPWGVKNFSLATNPKKGYKKGKEIKDE